MLIVIGHRMIGLKIFAPKLIDVKSAFINVEMNISLLKIRCTGFPNLGFGVQSLDLLPRAVADALGVLFWRNEQNLQLVVVCFFIDFSNYTANALTVNNDTVGLTIR